jgi:hypothetical protein
MGEGGGTALSRGFGSTPTYGRWCRGDDEGTALFSFTLNLGFVYPDLSHKMSDG